ncbi:MAG: hypothetical protein BJ554DRAFT_5563, partial [Olpidium bornovanus]
MPYTPTSRSHGAKKGFAGKFKNVRLKASRCRRGCATRRNGPATRKTCCFILRLTGTRCGRR